MLRLPPDIRSVLAQTRSFSSTPSRKDTVADLAVAGPTAILNGIHGLGIPWYATLPLTAVLVRGTFVYYFASRPDRIQARKTALLMPLINAKADVLMGTRYVGALRKIREERDGPFKLLRYNSVRWWARMAATSEIGRHHGSRLLPGRALLSFGMLIAFTEAIRLKCGSPVGLLSTLLSPFQWLAQKVDPERFPKPVESPAIEPSEMLAERLAASREGHPSTSHLSADTSPGASQASDILNSPIYQSENTTNLAPLDGMDTSTAYFDPSLMTEGLSWFTDLTGPDTTLLLPATLGLTMLVTALFRPTVGKPLSAIRPKKADSNSGKQTQGSSSSDADPGKAGDEAAKATIAYFEGLGSMQRFGILMSPVFFLVGLKLPVAVLLYFIPSIALGWLQSRWLDLKYPIPQPIQKCSRPLWVRATRQWVNPRR